MEKGKIDYQVPVTHLKGAKGDGGNRRYASSKQWDQKEMEVGYQGNVDMQMNMVMWAVDLSIMGVRGVIGR